MQNTTLSPHPRHRPAAGPSEGALAHDALALVVWMTVATVRLYLWLLKCVIQAPFWLLFALCGRHYVVRRNGKTSRVSVWRYW